MAQYAQEPGLLLEAHYALGVALFFSGAFAAADTHLENGLALYDPQQRQASFTASIPAWGVAAISLYAMAPWISGPGAAAECRDTGPGARAVTPLQSGAALCFAAMLQQYCRDVAMVRTCYRGLALCQTHGFAQFLAQAQVMHGWAVATQDQADAGLAQMHQGLIATRATGAEMPRPYFLGLLAETPRTARQPEAGTAIAEGLAMTPGFGEYWYEAGCPGCTAPCWCRLESGGPHWSVVRPHAASGAAWRGGGGESAPSVEHCPPPGAKSWSYAPP